MREVQFRVFASLVVVLLGVIAYGNTFQGDWVWDDASSVLVHQHVQDPSQLLRLFKEDQHAFGRGQGNFYRPLVSASFMLEYAISHDPAYDASHLAVKPALFHAGNLAWHLAAALLLLALLFRLGAPRFAALATACIFVVHPLHTEAVAYISGRADMMSAAFMFAGLFFAVVRCRPVPLLLSALCLVLALLSKESSLIFPVLLAVLLFLRRLEKQEAAAPLVKRLIPLAAPVALVVGYGMLRATVLKFAESATEAAPLGQRLVETGQAFTFYMGKLFWPANLHMEQTLAGYGAGRAFLGWGLIFVLMLILGAALWFRQRRIAMGLGWFLAAWFPISGIFPLNAPMAEHWMYVPMVGFWWAVAETVLLVGRGMAADSVRTAAVFALCVLLLTLTVSRNRDWRDNESIYRATLADNPGSERVRFNLAVSYQDILKNDAGARREYERLLRQYAARREAAAVSGEDYLLPNEDELVLSIGRVLVRQEQYESALPHFARLISVTRNATFEGAGGEALRASVAAAALEAGRCLLALGDPRQAANAFGRAVQLDNTLGPYVERLMAGEASLRDG